MKNLENMNDIKAIVIPTCDDIENIRRPKTEIKEEEKVNDNKVEKEEDKKEQKEEDGRENIQ